MKVQDFKSILLIYLSCILLTVIVPGYVSYIGGTFYSQDIRKKIPLDRLKILAEYEMTKDSLANLIFSIENSIATKIVQDGSEKYLNLFQVKEELKKNLASLQPPILLIPYYLNPQTILWVGIYSALMVLIYLITKKNGITLIIGKSSIQLSLIVYIFYEWPLWLRNFVFSSSGRTIYAYPNIDIDLYSFLCQELVVFGFCLLSSVLIVKCFDIENQNLTIKASGTLEKYLVIASLSSTAYRNWLIYSVILFLGFLSFTNFFWQLVFKYGDQRYVISALNAHILWALCWVAISLDLLRHLRFLDKIKLEILSKNPTDQAVNILMHHNPNGNIVLIITGLTSLSAFLFPLVKYFIG
ncbi:hypothetical protein BH09BAC1_BH09BAC1_02550 [soil metagenome]